MWHRTRPFSRAKCSHQLPHVYHSSTTSTEAHGSFLALLGAVIMSTTNLSATERTAL